MISGHVGFCRGRCDDIAESAVVVIDVRKPSAILSIIETALSVYLGPGCGVP